MGQGGERDGGDFALAVIGLLRCLEEVVLFEGRCFKTETWALIIGQSKHDPRVYFKNIL